MSIKEQIGQRIQSERLAKGLTRKALEELTADLKQSRINNWERGIRTPGPEEIKQLAKALDVSPAYLMCLTDEKQPKIIPGLGALIPLLNYIEANNPRAAIKSIRNDETLKEVNFIPVSAELAPNLSQDAFALEVTDESMLPELRPKDILIVDTNSNFQPGSLVVALISSEQKVIVRRYKQLELLGAFKSFELKAENENWGNVKIETKNAGKIIGAVKCIIRYI
jgi:SOS-response transcriptional repressor LexA